MIDSCVIDSNHCFHNDVCKVKEEFEKFTKPEFPDYICFSFFCRYFSSRKPSCRKVPNFYSNTECSNCAHNKICDIANLIHEGQMLLKEVMDKNHVVFQYIGVTFDCKFYECEEKEVKDE